MTELRQVPEELRQDRNYQPFPWGTFLVLIVLVAISYGLYLVSKYVYVNFGPDQQAQQLEEVGYSQSSDHSIEIQDDNDTQGRTDASNGFNTEGADDTQKRQREVNFTNTTIWWGTRLYYTFIAMGISFLIALTNFVIFDNFLTGMHDNVPVVCAVFSLFLIALVWPWFYYFLIY